LAHAEAIEARVLEAENLVAGKDTTLEGELRITASEWMIATILAPLLPPFLAEHGGLSLDLVAEARHLNLFRREADIALRPSSFDQSEVRQRAIAVLQFGLYASADYLRRRGTPDYSHGGHGHLLVAAGTGLGNTLVDAQWLPPILGGARVTARANGRLLMAQLAAAGAGIACLPRPLGDSIAGLRRLPTPGPAPRPQIWMGVHRNARAIRRVKAATDFLADAFHRVRGALDPKD
ncbi:MAG: LysR family transcriptional regulator, partial [Polyangia bacterium]